MNRNAVGLFSVAMLVACVVGTVASPPAGVTPTLIGRGTYDRFKVKSPPSSPIKVDVQANTAVDMVVRTHDYDVGSSTGWHTHPGPVFITVVEGAVTFYEADDPTCTPKVVYAGEGYVDTGRGHLGRNESGQPARDVTVILAPVGEPFRGELPEPGQHCGF